MLRAPCHPLSLHPFAALLGQAQLLLSACAPQHSKQVFWCLAHTMSEDKSNSRLLQFDLDFDPQAEAAKEFKPQLQYLREYIFNLDDGTTKERIVTKEVSGDFPVVPRKFVGALGVPLLLGD